MKDLISEIDERFTSGNGIPVERASIRADEWQKLKQMFYDTVPPLSADAISECTFTGGTLTITAER